MRPPPVSRAVALAGQRLVQRVEQVGSGDRLEQDRVRLRPAWRSAPGGRARTALTITTQRLLLAGALRAHFAAAPARHPAPSCASRPAPRRSAVPRLALAVASSAVIAPESSSAASPRRAWSACQVVAAGAVVVRPPARAQLAQRRRHAARAFRRLGPISRGSVTSTGMSLPSPGRSHRRSCHPSARSSGGDRQAQAGAAEAPRVALVGLREGLNSCAAAVGLDADAGVAHREAQRACRSALRRSSDASATSPRSVNLIALPARLSSTCCRRCASPISASPAARPEFIDADDDLEVLAAGVEDHQRGHRLAAARAEQAERRRRHIPCGPPRPSRSRGRR
jgi:hypothetical protein